MSSIIIEFKTPAGVDKIKWIITDKTPVWVWILGICTAFSHWLLLIILPQFLEIIISNTFGENYNREWVAQLVTYLGWHTLVWYALVAWLVIVLIEYIIRTILWARVKYRGYKQQKKLLPKETSES